MSITTTASATTAPTEFLRVKDETYAYRRIGGGFRRPLLCLQHFTGTLDNWDPAVTDPLGDGREVILFDSAGVGRSTGTVPTTVAGMAAHTLQFLDGLCVTSCDVLGFSLGGMVAQQMALDRPSSIHRMILVGTAPRGGEDIMHLDKPSLAKHLADPTLTGCAERVEVELRQQVSDEVGAAFDVEPPPGLARRPDFQPLDAQVEPGGMIVAGVHYGRAEVDAARRLLRELGQPERALRSVLEFVRRERVGGPPPPPTPVPAHRRVEHKRRALDRLARRWAQLRRELDPSYSWPQAQARVNRAMGVKRRADAGEGELDAGLDFLRRELSKLARDYPEQAERLRIAGSVEGIDHRLGAATGQPPR